MADSTQFCTFWLDRHFLGIDITEVQEIVPPRPITPVARAPRAVEGLINLRGQILTAIDLRRTMALPARSSDAQPMIVVVKSGDDPVGFLVDRVGDIERTNTDSFERPPDTLRGVARSVLRGAHKLPQRLLLILDTATAIRLAITGDAPMALPTR